jgi:hypothetical protein
MSGEPPSRARHSLLVKSFTSDVDIAFDLRKRAMSALT